MAIQNWLQNSKSSRIRARDTADLLASIPVVRSFPGRRGGQPDWTCHGQARHLDRALPRNRSDQVQGVQVGSNEEIETASESQQAEGNTTASEEQERRKER